MKLERWQKQRKLTDLELARKAGVSTATIYRVKTKKEEKKAKKPHYGPMDQMAAALECDVWDIDEFRDVLREKVYRDAEKVGAPPQVIDEADQMAEMFNIAVSDEGTVQQAAYRLMGDIIAYLDRSGRTDLIDRAFRERQT
jgi:transcriptional regulator with XRE-family HTH domain